jgi:hypothetical protein
LNAECETLRQIVYEVEQAQRLHSREIARRIMVTAVLGVVLFGVLVLWLSL